MKFRWFLYGIQAIGLLLIGIIGMYIWVSFSKGSEAKKKSELSAQIEDYYEDIQRYTYYEAILKKTTLAVAQAAMEEGGSTELRRLLIKYQLRGTVKLKNGKDINFP